METSISMMTLPIPFHLRCLAECEQSGFNRQANMAWGPRQVRGDSIHIFKLCACLLDPLNLHSVMWRIGNEIGDELLVSVPQTHLKKSQIM